MYIEEQKFKVFNPFKKIEAILGKGIVKARNLPDDDVLQPTSLDNRWIVKSQTLTILIEWYFFRNNPFVDYACCFCKYILEDNFYKHHLAIFFKKFQINVRTL